MLSAPEELQRGIITGYIIGWLQTIQIHNSLKQSSSNLNLKLLLLGESQKLIHPDKEFSQTS